MKKLLFAGYIGCGNLGDDAITLGLLNALGDSPYDVTILSGHVEATLNNYGLKSVPRKNFSIVDGALEECDALVFPGGSIFQDVTSVRSVAYYSLLIKKAKKLNKKVVLLGQGVGPLGRFWGKRLATMAFKQADVVAVRDPASATAIKALGVHRPVIGTADPAFLLAPPNVAHDAKGFEVAGMRTVGLAPRPFGKGTEVAELFGQICKLLFAANFVPVLIEMDKNEDGPLIQEISTRMGGKIPDLRRLKSPKEMQERLARMDGVLAMRLHAGILAATVGVPPLMLNYDPKVDSFAKQIGVGNALPLKGANPQKIFEAFMRFLKDRDRNAPIVLRKRDELAKMAFKNVELLRQALGE